MVKKAHLAKFIRTGNHSIQEWYAFMPKITGLRVKEVGSQGDVLISLDDSGWFKPANWLVNYQAQVTEELHRELEKVEAVLAPQEIESLLSQYGSKADSVSLSETDRIRYMQMCRKTDQTTAARFFNVLHHLLKKYFKEEGLSAELYSVVEDNPYQR